MGFPNSDSTKKNSKAAQLPQSIAKHRVIAIAKEFLLKNPGATKKDAILEMRRNGIVLSDKSIRAYLAGLGYANCKTRERKTGLKPVDVWKKSYEQAKIGNQFNQLIRIVR